MWVIYWGMSSEENCKERERQDRCGEKLDKDVGSTEVQLQFETIGALNHEWYSRVVLPCDNRVFLSLLLLNTISLSCWPWSTMGMRACSFRYFDQHFLTSCLYIAFLQFLQYFNFLKSSLYLFWWSAIFIITIGIRWLIEGSDDG